MKEIKEQITDIIVVGDGIRVELMMETLDGEDWLVIDTKSAVRFKPAGESAGLTIMDLDFEDIIFELKRRRYE